MKQVIMVGAKMSGDRNTIASILALDENLCVCVYGDRAEDCKDLFEFFVTLFPQRTVLYVVPQNRSGQLNTQVKQLAQKSLNWNAQSSKTVRDAVAAIGIVLKDKVFLHVATYGTELMKQAFWKDADLTRASLRKYWAGFYDNRFPEFLKQVGIGKGKGKYVFLWCKTGDFSKEKAHHYTDPLTWKLFCAGIQDAGWIPVLTGDDMGWRTEVSLVEYWNHWKKCTNEEMGRSVQMALWVYLQNLLGDDCCAIGMRSGILEVPALVGIRTLYLEEAENQQRLRMAKWLNVVNTWFRAIIPEPPGLRQFHYYLADVGKHGTKGDTELMPATLAQLKSKGGVAGIMEALNARSKAYVEVALAFAVSSSVENSPLKKYVGLVLEYLGYDERTGRGPDVLDMQRVMNASSLCSIVGWVVNPGATAFQNQNDQDIAQQVLKTATAVIQGGEVKQASKFQWSMTAKPSMGQPVLAVPSGESKAVTAFKWEVGGPLDELDRAAAEKEFAQLVELKQLLANKPDEAYWQVSSRLLELSLRYGFKLPW